MVTSVDMRQPWTRRRFRFHSVPSLVFGHYRVWSARSAPVSLAQVFRRTTSASPSASDARGTTRIPRIFFVDARGFRTTPLTDTTTEGAAPCSSPGRAPYRWTTRWSHSCKPMSPSAGRKRSCRPPALVVVGREDDAVAEVECHVGAIGPAGTEELVQPLPAGQDHHAGVGLGGGAHRNGAW